MKKRNKDLNNILNLFDFSKYKNLLSNFLQNTSNEILEPDCRYYAYKVYKYFYSLYFTYIYPVYNFNTILSKFCNNEDNICFVDDSNRYKNYEAFIDFFELIKAIFNTEFNKNENLNTHFKKELIYFLINSQNSLIHIFIQEVYNLIKIEMVKNGKANKKIKYKFKIKVQQGFKYSDKFISKIKEDLYKNIFWKDNKENIKLKPIEEQSKEKIEENQNINININDESKNKNDKNIKNEINISNEINITNEINNNIHLNTESSNSNNALPQKKKKFKLKLNRNINDVNNNQNNPNLISKESKMNNSLDNSNNNNNNNVIVIKNNYKRKSIPISGYQGFVPNTTNLIGKSEANHKKNIFNNEILFINKNEYKESINLEKKERKKISIFNMIFKVSCLKKDEIILDQYDISDILDKNLDEYNLERIIFESNFSTPDLPKYWDKLLNLAFIYTQLKFRPYI